MMSTRAVVAPPHHWLVNLDWIECHPGTASWVQGVGSILGLLVAIVVVSLSDRAERRRARDKLANLNTNAMFLAALLGSAMELPYRVFSDPDAPEKMRRSEVDFSSFEQADIMFSAFPIFELENSDAIMALTQMHIAARSAKLRMDYGVAQVRQGENPTVPFMQDLHGRFADAAEKLTDVTNALAQQSTMRDIFPLRVWFAVRKRWDRLRHRKQPPATA